jgi:hypothetical protein
MRTLSLARIICGNGNQDKYVERIKGYTVITGESRRFYCTASPVIYEDAKGEQWSADLTEIVRVDLAKATGHIGSAYRVNNESIYSL